MQKFFATIKAHDHEIKFVFITGVSSFTKAGIFSGMNNLQILTLKEEFAGICGYTDEEVDRYFNDHMASWTKNKDTAYNTIRDELGVWYNG